MSNTPILGFSAWSGTGKTTLLRQLIPALKARGLRVSVIKHAHHHFDLDFPGKDSYELRKAGAAQTVICTTTRMATITEFDRPEDEPDLWHIVESLDQRVDLILIEGYKDLRFPKIELHRAAVGKPLTIAVWGQDVFPMQYPGVNIQHKVLMGPLPVTGGWVRLEMPADQMNLEGGEVRAVTMSVHGQGTVIWDRWGKISGN